LPSLVLFKGGQLDFVTDRIAIGCIDDLDLNKLRANGITGVLNVAVSINVSRAIANHIEYCKIAIRDNEDNLTTTLQAAVMVMDQLLANHQKIMVNCRVGASRSVTVVALWLVMHQQAGSLEAALAMIKQKRKQAGPQPGMILLANKLLADHTGQLLANLGVEPVI
jgi:protein-tyrosine phosphatase